MRFDELPRRCASARTRERRYGLGCFETNGEQMRDDFREPLLSVGSGAVEAGLKTVARQRCKHPRHAKQCTKLTPCLPYAAGSSAGATEPIGSTGRSQPDRILPQI